MKKQKKDIVEKLNEDIKKAKETVEKQVDEKKQKKEVDKKKEKNRWLKHKTIKHVVEFLEAIIYIISIIVVIFANLYGPIYIQMIPLLFLLGIVGKLFFDRPVTTTVFGMMVAICVVYTTGIKSISQNLLISGCMAGYIALGEICAFALQKSYVYLKKKKKRFSHKACISYSITLITLIIALTIYHYTNSNIFELNQAKDRLYGYLSQHYEDMTFTIIDAKYHFLGEKAFSFHVKENETKKEYQFVVSKDDKFAIEDGMEKSKIALKEKEANQKLIEYWKEKDLTEAYKDYTIQIKVNEIDNYELEISKKEEEITEEKVLNYAKTVAKIIRDIKEFAYFKDLEHILISLENTKDPTQSLVSYLYVERYLNKGVEKIEQDYPYIQKALNVEYVK